MHTWYLCIHVCHNQSPELLKIPIIKDILHCTAPKFKQFRRHSVRGHAAGVLPYVTDHTVIFYRPYGFREDW